MSPIISTPSTPSPPLRVHTPTTPRFGYGDSWEPYSPRKSSRIAQRQSQRTPSPRASSRNRNSARITSSSSDVTPAVSPQKKRQPAMDSVRRASKNSGAGSAADAADSLRIGNSHQKKKSISTAITGTMMLPTPDKTPAKKLDEKSKANVSSIARNLFSESEAMPSPKKRKTKKYSGLTLDSFKAETIDEPIEIFTDTRDRIPEEDKTADNPFYEQPASTSDHDQPVRQTRSKLVYVEGEGKITIEEALKREDGIIYVFRGKRIFRKFSQDDEDVDEHDDDAPIRTNTRSSIKPRLLFPSKKQDTVKASTDDEEAVTDIEDHASLDDISDDPTELAKTPTTKVVEEAVTPTAPKFKTPVSPPSTIRATRASARVAAATGSPTKQTKPRNPFDGWRRSKSRASTQGQKREGEDLAGQNETSKRQRV
ncbi:hypothetical protein F5Y02DRAFT_382245 [Annulohypoxylon stygium]|nr:hypothetical protein F5Y02DRAFT_382245 [Annulohypoxylon stygium]